MPVRNSRRFLGRMLQGLQASAQDAGPAAAAGYGLVGAIVVLGGIGYAVDLWRDSSPWGLIVGLTLGVIVGFYQLIKSVWHRP